MFFICSTYRGLIINFVLEQFYQLRSIHRFPLDWSFFKLEYWKPILKHIMLHSLYTALGAFNLVS